METTTCIDCLLPFGLILGEGEKVERSASMPNALCESCLEDWQHEDAALSGEVA
jgi:hypothetical protein